MPRDQGLRPEDELGLAGWDLGHRQLSPRRGSGSRGEEQFHHKRGAPAESPRASPILLPALLSPWSKSTKVSWLQSFFCRSSRVTTSPECSTSIAKSWS